MIGNESEICYYYKSSDWKFKTPWHFPYNYVPISGHTYLIVIYTEVTDNRLI